MATPLNEQQIADIKKALKKCNDDVIEATLRFHNNNDMETVPLIIREIIKAHLPTADQNTLSEATDETRLMEDLGIDSLTLLEVAMLIEEVLLISIPDADLRNIRTLGDINQFISKTRAERGM